MLARHPATGFYVFASVFPFSAVMLCWVFFYSLGHYTPGRLLTISETVIPFPENRIFAIGMHAEIVILFVLYYIRNKVISHYAERRSVKLAVRQFICRILTIIVPIGLSLVSALTLVDEMATHLFGAFLFFYGSISYYILSDSSLSAVGCPPSGFSRVLSWSCLGFSVIYSSFGTQAHARGPGWISFANWCALFQYVTAFLIFLKIFVFSFNLPKHDAAVLLVSQD